MTYSDLLAITKQRFDPETNSYKKKTRTVLNLKKSGIPKRTCLRHKGGLPRATDAIGDILTLMDDSLQSEVLEQLVMDIADAFWIVPSNPDERKHFVTRIGKIIVIMLRTTQGSRDAGLTWATIAAPPTWPAPPRPRPP